MRPRGRHLTLAALLGVTGAIALGLGATQAAPPSIVAVDPYSWQANGTSPAAVAILAGGEVKFSYPSGATRHYPVLHSGPVGASLQCSNVPTTELSAGPGWSGSCTFSQAGTYTIYCGVHGALMTATVTVSSAGEPTVSTEAATSVSEHEATLNGTVNANGHSTTYRFEYGTTTGYGNKIAGPSPVEGSEAVSAPIGGLAAGTTYHFRLVATNEKGTTDGPDETFTTQGPPSATTGEAKPVGETEATLKGTVNPDGKPTKYYFEWGTSEGYDQVTSEVPAGEGHFAQAVSSTITGLAPGQTYHYRVVAKNGSAEMAFGEDQTLETASPPPPPAKEEPAPPPANPAPGPTPTPTPGPISPEPKAPPLVSPLVGGSLKLIASRHQGGLRVSLAVSQGGAPARLEVDVLAKAGHGHRQTLVGRLVRGSLAAGKASFSVALNAHGKSVLRRQRKLAVSVEVTLTPPIADGAVKVTRKALLRA